MKSSLCFLSLVICLTRAIAGNGLPNEEKVWDRRIKTVQFYNTIQEQSFPMIELNGSDKLQLSFDDLGGGVRNLFYAIEPCNPDWTSNTYLLPNDYMQGYNEVRISNFHFSFNTLQKYTHYETTFPDDNLQPIVSGNFLLKVYEDSDPTKVIFTKRFCVLEKTLGLSVQMVRAPMIEDRDSKHKVNFSIGIGGGTRIANPYTDIVAVVMQNYRWDIVKYNTKPQFVRPESLEYSQDEANVFNAGNEFRRFDIKSMRYKTDRVDQTFIDTTNHVRLFCDRGRNFDRYASLQDLDGGYFVRVQEFTNPSYEADYAWVKFCLPWESIIAQGEVYVQGKFTDWAYSDNNLLKYDFNAHAYKGELYLKQGIYDYQYVVKTSSSIDIASTEGNRMETENTYQVLVYHKVSGANYYRLAAFTTINSQSAYR